jgi:hypothetical protein
MITGEQITIYNQFERFKVPSVFRTDLGEIPIPDHIAVKAAAAPKRVRYVTVDVDTGAPVIELEADCPELDAWEEAAYSRQRDAFIASFGSDL